jgi:hypothetical protein
MSNQLSRLAPYRYQKCRLSVIGGLGIECLKDVDVAFYSGLRNAEIAPNQVLADARTLECIRAVILACIGCAGELFVIRRRLNKAQGILRETVDELKHSRK